MAGCPKGHRPLVGEPGGELLVGFDEAARASAQDDGAESVQDVVGPVRLSRDLGVQPDECFAQIVLSWDLMRLPVKVLWCEEVPTEARNRAVSASKTRAYGGVVGDATAESVAHKGFDGVCFVEG
jgi:hypothetical protein